MHFGSGRECRDMNASTEGVPCWSWSAECCKTRINTFASLYGSPAILLQLPYSLLRHISPHNLQIRNRCGYETRAWEELIVYVCRRLRYVPREFVLNLFINSNIQLGAVFVLFNLRIFIRYGKKYRIVP